MSLQWAAKGNSAEIKSPQDTKLIRRMQVVLSEVSSVLKTTDFKLLVRRNIVYLFLIILKKKNSLVFNALISALACFLDNIDTLSCNSTYVSC